MIEVIDKMHEGPLEKLEKYIRFNSAFAYYNPEFWVSFTTMAGELGEPMRLKRRLIRFRKYQDFLSEIIGG